MFEEEIVKSPTVDEFGKTRRLLDIQSKFENGFIQESDLTEEEKISLDNLYKKQIEILENNIECYKNMLIDYREKIIEAQNKLQ